MNWIGFKYWKTAVFPLLVTFFTSLSAAAAQEVVKLPLVLGQDGTYESSAPNLYADELYLPSADVVTTPDEAYRQLVAGNAGYLNESSDVALTTDVRGRVYPLATILSVAMMLRYSLDQSEAADAIENAVNEALKKYRTPDIYSEGMIKVSCTEMGDKVCEFI